MTLHAMESQINMTEKGTPDRTDTSPGTHCIATEVPEDRDPSWQEARVRGQTGENVFQLTVIPDGRASFDFN